jgi:methylmalonyl-CoA mutase
VAARLLELAASRQTPTGSLRGSLGADPIAVQARGGAAADLALLQGFAAHVAGFPDLRLSTVDATVYHEAGGSDADELAVATSVGVAYLRAFTDAGLSIDAALAALEFRFAVTADQFGSIAKLRAARRMWDRVAELSGADPKRRGQRQHATTSTAMLTRRDPWVNLLRATIGCFAAAVAGADAITVYPYDGALGLPDDFSRRLARNTQAILAQESSLGRVLDAAGGSWYVEARTQALADRAWALFTSLERAGGALAALNSGFLDEQLSAAREARRADVAHRRAPITGVSEFALLTEEVLDRRCASATGSDDAAQGSVGSGVGSLSALRYAEPFEALRDRADAQLAATGARPRVVLATFGPVAAHSAAVGLAANLFAAGGIETVAVPDEAGDRDEVLALYGTTVVCLCPPDPSYAGPTFAAAEKWMAAGVTRLWLVGRPADWPDARDLGVAGHLSSGIDAIAVLGSTLDSLRVAA